MNIFSSCDAPAILDEFDLSEFGSMCDLGGEYIRGSTHFKATSQDFDLVIYISVANCYKMRPST